MIFLFLIKSRIAFNLLLANYCKMFFIYLYNIDIYRSILNYAFFKKQRKGRIFKNSAFLI